MRLLVGLVAASALLTTPTLAEVMIIYHTHTASLRDAVAIRAQQAGCSFFRTAPAVGSLTGWLVVVTGCPRLPEGTPGVEIIGRTLQ
ncbi:hypothetical protein BDV23DRAFT_153537 [Aspergillus alliaceus]|uniref:Uncharacterized protein n=1 Tax=Petromyces alliaceus TaxID=209559 RepID=A0A5N7CAK0_PETAA|nr:uncharacterized protein BDW43DRAFT_282041 [Aspergillus alliaceus]KAB8231637.1 hypothetical protein BDW43DRAFT_282041 [Aspergillus alliaceus]KAE8391176.1 hypothetical protein BDV23DRAFT_153537 [Aspergillus alliaceus]